MGILTWQSNGIELPMADWQNKIGNMTFCLWYHHHIPINSKLVHIRPQSGRRGKTPAGGENCTMKMGCNLCRPSVLFDLHPTFILGSPENSGPHPPSTFLSLSACSVHNWQWRLLLDHSQRNTRLWWLQTIAHTRQPFFADVMASWQSFIHF